VADERATVGWRDVWVVVRASAERRLGRPLFVIYLVLAIVGAERGGVALGDAFMTQNMASLSRASESSSLRSRRGSSEFSSLACLTLFKTRATWRIWSRGCSTKASMTDGDRVLRRGHQVMV
jgi:hypothetical protein